MIVPLLPKTRDDLAVCYCEAPEIEKKGKRKSYSKLTGDQLHLKRMAAQEHSHFIIV
jgi:hypothetical protein